MKQEKATPLRALLFVIILLIILVSEVQIYSLLANNFTPINSNVKPKVSNSPDFNLTPPHSLLSNEELGPNAIFTPLLKQYAEGVSPSKLGLHVRPDGKMLVGIISKKPPSNWITPPAPFGRYWFSVITVSSPLELRNDVLLYNVVRAFDWAPAPKDVFLQSTDNNNSEVISNYFDPPAILGARTAWAEGYSGNGVTVGIVDSGVDFGNSDIKNRLKRLNDGTPAVFDPSGAGLVLTPVSLTPVNEEGLELLKLSNLTDFKIWTGEQFQLVNSSQLGLHLSDLDITSIPVKSVSGVYKFGIGFEPIGKYVQVMLSVLVDSQQPHVYDTLYIDMDTSLALSLVLSGIIFDGSKTYRQLADWTLNDDAPFVFRSNDVLAKDSNGDGINDISFGVLGNTLDLYGVLNGELVSGILSDGSGYSVFYDYVGHGTSAAASIVSEGKAKYPIFDNKETDVIENSTFYKLFGTAPNASIVAAKFYSLTDIFNSWYWAMGLEPDFQQGTWVYNNQHHSDIISNSFGVSDINVLGSVRGLDPLALFVDYASIPHEIDPLYPGSVFVIASGNGGPGVGTSSTPGIAGTAITVGATSFKYFLDYEEKTPQSAYQMAMFSSRGPSPLFIAKPDVSAVGEFWCEPAPLITGKGNGTEAFILFGGTSQATPFAAGTIALLVQAMKEHNIDPSLPLVKEFLMLGAKDLSLPTTLQGAGQINITKSINLALRLKAPPLKTSGTSDYAERINDAFKRIFGMQNPLLSLTENYVPTYLGNGYEKNITSLIPGTTSFQLPSFRLSLIETLSGKTYGRYSKSMVLLSASEISSSAVGLRIEFSFTQDSWNAIMSSGMEKPFKIGIIDWVDKNSNGQIDSPANVSYPNGERIFLVEYSMLGEKTILDLSLKTYSLKGKLALVIIDPDGSPQKDLMSRNFKFNINIYELHETTLPVFREQRNETLTLRLNKSKAFQGKLIINTINDSFVLPISMTNYAFLSLNSSTNSPYLNASINGPNYVFGTPNLLGRPDQGETYFVNFKITGEAELIPIIVDWLDSTTIVDLYLADGSGNIVVTSKINYLGGGYFDSLKTAPTQQRLLYIRSPTSQNETYLLVLHVTTPPIALRFDSLNITIRALKKQQLKSPNPILTPKTPKISGKLFINTPKYDSENFPELKLTNLEVTLKSNNKTRIRKTIPTVNPSNSSFDYVYTLKLNKNVPSSIIVSSNESDGLISVILLKPQSVISLESDILNGYGLQSSRDTVFTYVPESSGDYLLAIDISNTTITSNYHITITIVKSISLEIPFSSLNVSILTDRIPDGNYTINLIYYTNFEPLTFNISITKVFENPRTLKILKDSSISTNQLLAGQKVSLTLPIQYSGNLSVFTVISLQSLEVNHSLAIMLFLNSYQKDYDLTIPSTIPTGNYVLIITVSDGIVSSTITFKIHVVQIKTSILNAPFGSLFISLSSMFLLLIVKKKKREKKQINS